MRRGKRSRQRERPLRTAGPAYFQNLSTSPMTNTKMIRPGRT